MVIGSFGYTIGSTSSYSTSSANFRYGTYFVLPESGAVTNIYAYLDASATDQARAGIYRYAPGSEFIIDTDLKSISTTRQWYDFSISGGSYILAPGSYVLSIIVEDGNVQLVNDGDFVNRTASDPNTFPFFEGAWLNGEADFTTDYALIIYATYEIITGSEAPSVPSSIMHYTDGLNWVVYE